jgi:hypothetical protein
MLNDGLQRRVLVNSYTFGIGKQSIALGKRLPIKMTYPFFRAIGGDNKERYMTVVGFRNGWKCIKKRRSRGDANNGRATRFKVNTNGHKSGRAFIGDRVKRETCLMKIMTQGRIASTRTHDNIRNAQVK